MDSMPCYVYILKCSDNTLYTGWTTDLSHRIRTHNSGKGAKYTRARLPVVLVYYEVFSNHTAAKKREYQLKQLTRLQKLDLIAQQN